MGTVYQALDTRLGRTVAVKFLAQTLQSVEMCDRFEVEAKAAAQLSAKTQYLVSVSDYGVDQSNRPFYVMEYLQGRSLKNRMRPSLPLPVFLNLTQQICLGLQCAHEGIRLARHAPRYPVIHCDLKPSNIFVTSEPIMLTGKLPLYPKTLSFRDPKFQDWHQTHQSQTPRALTEAVPDRPFPKSLETLILRCLAKQPNDRPQSATEIFQELRVLGAQFNVQLPPGFAAGQAILIPNGFTQATPGSRTGRSGNIAVRSGWIDGSVQSAIWVECCR